MEDQSIPQFNIHNKFLLLYFKPKWELTQQQCWEKEFEINHNDYYEKKFFLELIHRNQQARFYIVKCDKANSQRLSGCRKEDGCMSNVSAHNHKEWRVSLIDGLVCRCFASLPLFSFAYFFFWTNFIVNYPLGLHLNPVLFPSVKPVSSPKPKRS